MIHVKKASEPDDFDNNVRRPGNQWIANKGLNPNSAPPRGTKLPKHWRKCLGQLHAAYDGICAYVCIYIDNVTGAKTVDHYVAKSKRLGLAYEWNNYRLACSRMNGMKLDFADVLDPFKVKNDMFCFESTSGKIFANPSLKAKAKKTVELTIERLALDDSDCRERRRKDFADFVQKKISSVYLKEKSPFVWREADRQGLL